MSVIRSQIEELFETARGRAGAAERSSFLDEACRGNAELRSEVESLLKAHDAASGFLVPVKPATPAPPPDLLGTRVGPYKLLQELGEGGMGAVYMAEQERPVRRRVALKIIKAGMDSAQVIARFEQERQALTMMDHPNIARALDAGTTGPESGHAGRPYFVMELVKGTPITRYCDQEHLTPAERLELFVPVCHAIQHAHQKGIIHRDVKPSNVLIALYDGRPVPKVIDFGVAKATSQTLTERTMFTQVGSMVGTLEYMAPEQAELNNLDVDTRADIYSLGVLLYELLTGTPPFTSQQLRSAAFAEKLRLIREVEPPRPSTRLSSSAELTTIAAQRKLEPQRLTKLVRYDLDWIVMKALEKDRSRRYETANALADDIQRFLHDEPVLAGPPRPGYRLAKLLKRNRGPVIAAAAVVIALVAGIAGTSWGLLVAGRALDSESTQRQVAEKLAGEIQQGFEHLRSALALQGRAVVFQEWRRWDDAASALDEAIRLCPELGSAWEARGNLYAELGLWDYALADRRRALELIEPALAGDWWSLAALMIHAGDRDAYRRLCERIRTRIRGSAHEDFVDLIRAECLMPGPDTDYQTAGARLRGRGGVIHDALHLYVQGLVHCRVGENEQAVARSLESLDIGPEWNQRALNYPLLALAYAKLGDSENARAYFRRATEERQRCVQELYLSGQSRWIVDKNVSARWLLPQYAWLEFNLLYDEARNQLHQPTPEVDVRLVVLRARAFVALGRYGEAEVEFKRAIELAPGDDLIRAEWHRSEAYRCVTARDYARGAMEFAEATRLVPSDAQLWTNQARAHLAAGNVEAYRRLCREILKRFRDTTDSDTADRVVRTCVDRADALPNMAELLPVAEVAVGGYPAAARVRGVAQVRAGRYKEAVRSFEDALRYSAPDNPAEICLEAIAYEHVGRSDEARRRLDAATRWIAEADSRTFPEIDRTKPCWANHAWHGRPEALLLLEEAKALHRDAPAVRTPAGVTAISRGLRPQADTPRSRPRESAAPWKGARTLRSRPGSNGYYALRNRRCRPSASAAG